MDYRSWGFGNAGRSRPLPQASLKDWMPRTSSGSPGLTSEQLCLPAGSGERRPRRPWTYSLGERLRTSPARHARHCCPVTHGNTTQPSPTESHHQGRLATAHPEASALRAPLAAAPGQCCSRCLRLQTLSPLLSSVASLSAFPFSFGSFHICPMHEPFSTHAGNKPWQTL